MFMIPGKEMSRGGTVSQVLAENDLEEGGGAGWWHAGGFSLEVGGSKMHGIRSGHRSRIISVIIVARFHVHKTESVMYMVTFFTYICRTYFSVSMY